MLRTTAIAKELAAIERKMQETDNATLKEALKKKQARLKAELKDPSQSATKLAKTLLAQREVVKQLSKVEFNDLIRRLSKKPEYAFLKTMPKSTVKNDLEVTAKPVGWRFKGRGNYDKPTKAEIIKGKKNGTVYREVRPRRSDVSQVVKLAEGGGVEKNTGYIVWGKDVYFAEWEGKIPTKENTKITDKTGNLMNGKAIYDALFPRLLKTLKMSHGGSMYAEGGSLEQESVEMINNQATSAKHHIDELKQVLSHQKEIEPWVIAKMQRATTDLADITHYLDGKDPKMAFGGIVYDLSNDAIDRMDGLAPIDAMQSLRNSVLEISRSFEEEGFEKDEIASYLSYMIVSHLNKMMAKGGLTGDQYKLDVNKNGHVDSEDLAMLRGDKMAKGGNIENFLDALKSFSEVKIITTNNDEKSSFSIPTKNWSYSYPEIFIVFEINNKLFTLFKSVDSGNYRVKNKFYICSVLADKPYKGSYEQNGDIYQIKSLKKLDNFYEYNALFQVNNENDIKDFVNNISDKMATGGSIEVGDKVKATKEYGGKSGKVVEKRGSFVVVEDSKGNTESYHESDLIKKMKEGGEIGYYTYKGESIMFEPHFKEYYVGDAGPFNTLDEAKEYIDGGSQTPDSIKDAYRKGLFAKGGQLTTAQQKKFDQVMHEWGEGKLHSGSEYGPIVKDQDQAIAIAYAEARGMKKIAKGGGVDENIIYEDKTLKIVKPFSGQPEEYKEFEIIVNGKTYYCDVFVNGNVPSRSENKLEKVFRKIYPKIWKEYDDMYDFAKGGSMAKGGYMGWKHKMKNGGYTGLKWIDPRVKELTDKLSRDNKNDVVKVVIDYHQDKNEKQTIDKLRDLGAKYSIKNDNETARNIAEIATIIMKHKMK